MFELSKTLKRELDTLNRHIVKGARGIYTPKLEPSSDSLIHGL